MNNNFLTTKDAAEKLNRSTYSVHQYVKQGKLKPVYKDRWRADRTLLFREEDVEALKEQLIKPEGMTTGEVAKALGLHISTVINWLKTGELQAEKKMYRGVETNFISNEDFNRLKESYSKQDRLSIMTKDNQYALFQSFINEETGEFARLIHIENEELLTTDGRKIPLLDALNTGFKAKYLLNESDYITQRGTAVFKMSVQLNAVASLAYKVIDFFYLYLGPKNIKCHHDGQFLHIETKPAKITLIGEQIEQYHEEIKLLRKSVINGNTDLRHNGVLITSDVEKINFHVSSEQKDMLKTLAKEQKMSLDDYISTLVENHLQEIKVKEENEQPN
ncbi:helix-turn-helix domain-containing protein [Gottfriedia luciferensis]|uniref:helix-turn-helix domain-containing protein n=1 Tax=Gottfriedia luciferensis TaxID=178774 RepID=UPI000B44C4FC|nr:helix-turn-helix domain-containing protein [Gottfriedia luciferensis]